MNDRVYIARAIKLAKKSMGHTSPNPMVGAVLVKKSKIIAEDYHQSPGTPHAEALVVSKAGDNAKGATLYVNLEPCSHTKKRTPPCTADIIRSKVKRVVVSMEDPNPQVSGKGIRQLRDAGIDVVTGVLEDEAKKLNETYIKYITERIPFVILKIAMTLDGKIALPTGESKWITGEKARMMVHKKRSTVDAILTAIGTVKLDNPELTARIKGGKDPIRIVVDPELEIPDYAKLLAVPPQTIIITALSKSKRVEELKARGVSFLFYKDRLNLKWLLKQLGFLEITSVLIEGGSSLASHAFEEGVVDKVMFFIAPKIVGGKDSYTAVGGKSCKSLEDAYSLRNITAKRIGEDIVVEGYVLKSQRSE